MQIANKTTKEFLIVLTEYAFLLGAARYLGGIAIAGLFILMLVNSVRKKFGHALGFFLIMIFMIVVNPNVVAPDNLNCAISIRLASIASGLVFIASSAGHRSRHSIPLAGLGVYLLVSCVSSIFGWAPSISYMKILNFALFVWGICGAANSISDDQKGVLRFRAGMLALAFIVVVGSLALKPFPGISTLTGLKMARHMDDVVTIGEMVKDQLMDHNLVLFCGMTNQSQALAPLCACCALWTLMDLMFVERRISIVHILIVVCAVPLLYMTRSRAGLFALLVGLYFAVAYLPQRMSITARTRVYISHLAKVLVAIVILGGIVAEFRSSAFSKWIRKTESVEGDQRSLSEAMTSSRQGLMELSWDDFYRNPFLGMGFQVAIYTPARVAQTKGLVLSSPIEKGVMPIMILGETGVVGAMVFVIFLIHFYGTTSRWRLCTTGALFAVFLVVNLGEASFFSPGGLGGCLWLVCVIGGYAIDAAVLNGWTGHYGNYVACVEEWEGR